MDKKVCKRCGRELPLSEFYKNKICKDGYRNECKECFKQQQKQYYQEHKEVMLEQAKQYKQEHKEEILEYQKQYRQDNKEYFKQYYQDNKEAILERHQECKEEIAEYMKQWMKQYRLTQIGRAKYLVDNYKRLDKEANRGECTLTPEWIIDNIFTKPCHWCGETDWHKLGCDRIDNDKPHTPDNVNPCCDKCNKKRGTKTYEEFLKLIKNEGLLHPNPSYNQSI